MTGLLIFFAGTLGNAYFSWQYSKKEGRYHGITRFISFECLLIIFSLNFSYWFSRPFSMKQLLSWPLLLASAYLAVTGFLALKKAGIKIGRSVKASQMVETSIFGLIRHPLYMSLILLGYGMMFKHVYPVQFLCAVINMITLYRVARTEEREMIRRFGQEYIDYMRKTRMFVPYLY